MDKTVQAEINDVDLILDVKLDIIFSSDEVANLEKNEMEKIVNYTEEDIRENINDYKLVYKENNLVGIYGISDYEDGKLIDLLYIMPNCRNMGIAKNILKGILNDNFEPIYINVYKNCEIAIDLLKKYNFLIEEEMEYKYQMKNTNVKEENNQIKIRMFESEVKKLAEKYGIQYSLTSKI